MLAALLAAAESPDWTAAVVSYGVAAPLIGFLVWRNNQDRADRDKAQARADELTDRLIDQNEKLVPIATEMTAALKAAADVQRQG